MKIAPLAILALTLFLGTLCAKATTLEPGLSIGISFGATKPDNNFNQCDPLDPSVQLTGTLSSVIDTLGTEVLGIVVRFGGANAVSNQLGTTQDFSNYTGFSLQNIQNAITGDNLTLSFTGLDPTQKFTLDLVSSYAPQNIGTKFTVGTYSITTNSQSTTGGTLAHFVDLVPDATGTITITALGQGGTVSWAGVNAAQLRVQAIPEPSAETLMTLIGIVVLTFHYRVRSLNYPHNRNS